MVSEARTRRRHRRAVEARAIALTALALLAVAVLVVGYLRLSHRGRIQPGVTIGGVDVGGLTPAEALTTVEGAGLDPQDPVILRAGEDEWALDPLAAGIAFDARATIAAAYGVGRQGLLPTALRAAVAARMRGHDVQPIVVLDPVAARAAVEGVADAFDYPARNAAIRIEGTEVVPTDAVIGQAINLEGALTALANAASRGQWPISALNLPYSIIQPEVSDASEAVVAARALLRAPITLGADAESWQLTPPTLGTMLTTNAHDGSLVLDLDRERFTEWLYPATEVVSRTAQAPRFRFDPVSAELILTRPGLSARRLNVDRTVERILAASTTGRRELPIATDETPPAIPDDVRAADLGIRELLREETSHYSGSSAGRIHNIQLAASKFDGLLVPPGATFSFNDNVGDISAEEGYEETLIIMDGATADGVGGGVCQVSTTLFRAAFWSGLPIRERLAHGYRVGYYEQNSVVGFDATVFGPVVDLKMENDTGSWLLIETEADPRATTLTFRLYGTMPDREVELVGPVIAEEVPPPAPRVEVDPELGPGESHVVEHARNGASVSLTRLIRTGGEEIREVFYSRYRPTGKVTAVSPAQAPPPPPGEATASATPAVATDVP